MKIRTKIRTSTLSPLLQVLVLVGCGGGSADDAGPSVDAARDAGVDAGFVCAADFECGDAVFCNGIERCVDARCQAGEPPCDPATLRCTEAEEICTPIDCSEPDADGDGYDSIACGGGDCDDDDDRRNPGTMEVCDVENVDEDCDPLTYGFRDADMDGDPDARCCNGENCGTDCDDMRPGVNTTVPEVCGNGFDDDCDGMMDEGLLVDGFADPDGDGWGDSTMPLMGVCPGASGFAAVGGDCDESDPAINPGATEACDEVDNNCSGVADEGLPSMVCYRDADGDGYGETAVSETRCACGSGWATARGDCADWNADVHPGATFRAGCYCTIRPPVPVGACFVVCGPDMSADWDCDGVTERRWTETAFDCSPVGGCSAIAWEGFVPSCGGVGTANICSPTCTFEQRSVAQECR